MLDQYVSFEVHPQTVPSQFVSHFSSIEADGPVGFVPNVKFFASKDEANRTVLVVDDVADVTEMLSVVLTQAGYAVVTAASAPQALEVARGSRFDVIISDIGMPGMNGYQLAREMRLLPGYDDVPMVAVTGYSMFDDRERSRNAGFTAHMTKPIDPRALLDLIDQL